MTSPAVPGAINIVSLAGNEIVPIVPRGQGAAQTTTQAIANLAGGGSGNTLTLTADTNLAAGTAVSLNSSGHVVQTWGPAPNVAGVVTLVASSSVTTTAQGNVTALDGNNFVGWTYTEASPGPGGSLHVLVSFTRSGSTLTVGTPNTDDISVNYVIPLTSVLFIAIDASLNAYYCTISGGVITIGDPVASGFSGAVSTGGLNSTSFVLASGGQAIVGTVSAGVITFGTPAAIGSGNFYKNNSQIEVLSATKFVVVFGDGANSKYLTGVACTVAVAVITAGTPAAISGYVSGFFTNAGVLSGSSFALGFSGDVLGNADTAGYGVIATISGTTITWGTPVYMTAFANAPALAVASPATYALAVVDSTHVSFGLGGARPQVCTVSGAVLTVPTPIVIENTGYPTPGALSINLSLGTFSTVSINSIVSPGSLLLVSDGVANVYEVDSSGNQSPYIQHAQLWNYGLSTGDSSHVVAWFFVWIGNFSARVIAVKPLNNSPPIGCVASAVTSGNPATVTLSGACSGFSGLTPGAQYFSNGDGTVTTGNTGHPIGLAATASQMIVQ